jgi:hypothetical protein
MKRLASLLVLLTAWGQCDDILAATFALPAAPFADDSDDDCLVPRRVEAEDLTSPQRPAFLGGRPTKVRLPLAWKSPASRPPLSTPDAFSSLYLLMSLQI